MNKNYCFLLFSKNLNSTFHISSNNDLDIYDYPKTIAKYKKQEEE